MDYYLGIDVGTGSARAGIFDANGEMIANSQCEISLWREGDDIVEQSSEDIWRAVCTASQAAIHQSGLHSTHIKGIGFDATCSLVVVGQGGVPLTISHTGDAQRNVIVWMDHRAVNEAEQINHHDYEVLRYVGGKISPEMQTPKLLWLKKHLPETYDSAWQFFDLVDYLTWRSTGDLTRSLCTLTCKWTYLSHENRWDTNYFYEIGLGDLADENFMRIGQCAKPAGTPLSGGLSAQAAYELGLSAGIAVGNGLIDAHAGGVGTVGVKNTPSHTLAYIFGTSSCTMTSTESPTFIDGIWGPYYHAMLPNFWLNEGGQSAAGAAMDCLLDTFSDNGERQAAQTANMPLMAYLEQQAIQQAGDASATIQLAKHLHLVPEFAGNRSPCPNPNSRALIAGLGMAKPSLTAIYIAGMASIAYGLRQIIETQIEAGVMTDNIVISGGAGKSVLAQQLIADVTGIPVIRTQAEEPVLLGAAILGAIAAKRYSDIQSAMKTMTHLANTCQPNIEYKEIHDYRYQHFLKLQKTAHQL